MANKTQLQKNYEKICNEYVKRFCKKQDFEFEYWVGKMIGSIAVCSDYYFNFSDIVYDIDGKQPKGAIINWYNDNLDEPKNAINYHSYIMGLRVADVIEVYKIPKEDKPTPKKKAKKKI